MKCGAVFDQHFGNLHAETQCMSSFYSSKECEQASTEALPTFVFYGSCLRHYGNYAEAIRVYDDGMFGKCPGARSRPKPEINSASSKRRRLDCDEHLDAGPSQQGDQSSSHSTPQHGWLQLTLVEGFYLAFVRRSIRIVRHVGSPADEMDEQGAWQAFCGIQPHFAHRFAAYRHYREQGLVPTGGIKYGIDHLLYDANKVSEMLAGKHQHAPFSALVHPQRQGQEQEGGCLTWRDVQSASRVACQVSKQLLLSFVEGDSDGRPGGVGLTVTDLILDRWEPERERDARAKSATREKV